MIQRYRDTEIRRYRDIEKLGYRDTEIQGFKHLLNYIIYHNKNLVFAQGYRYTGIKRYWDT